MHTSLLCISFYDGYAYKYEQDIYIHASAGSVHEHPSTSVKIIYCTCTTAVCRFTPLNPTATDAADIIMGPKRKRITIPIVALFAPQAIIRGWRAMNNPAISNHYQKYHLAP